MQSTSRVWWRCCTVCSSHRLWPLCPSDSALRRDSPGATQEPPRRCDQWTLHHNHLSQSHNNHLSQSHIQPNTNQKAFLGIHQPIDFHDWLPRLPLFKGWCARQTKWQTKCPFMILGEKKRLQMQFIIVYHCTKVWKYNHCIRLLCWNTKITVEDEKLVK